ncbi:MAG: ABC transporter permease [Nocardioidaceae bacterium]|nr:MAG: ABC transporter permease [Nocardioidaceae bacterium]
MSGFWARQRWWLGRVIALPFQLLLFAIIAFFLVRLIPGDPVLAVTGNQVSPEEYLAVKHRLGLDGSPITQLFNYLGRLVQGDLGESLISGRSVFDDIRTRLPATVELAAMSLLVSSILVFAVSVLIMFRPRNIISRAAVAFSRTAGSIPEFAVAIVFIFIFYAKLNWLPAPLGRLTPGSPTPVVVTHFPFLDALLTGDPAIIGSMLAHLVMPVAALVISISAVLLRLLNSQVEVEMQKPATRFRISTGAGIGTVILSVYRRALPGTVTMAGALFGNLIGSAVVLEGLFSFGGMGQYLVKAVQSADLTAMQGFLIVAAALSLVIFLLVDIVNMMLDPRRRPGVGAKP